MSNKIYQKIYIGVHCESEQEKIQVQKAFEELTGILRLNAKDIIKIAPFVRNNQSRIRGLFDKLLSGKFDFLMKMF